MNIASNSLKMICFIFLDDTSHFYGTNDISLKTVFKVNHYTAAILRKQDVKFLQMP